jgi:hypothetical protein
MVHGVFTQNDFDETFIPRLQEILNEFPTVNLVFEFDDDFTGWEFSALWREIQFSIEYFDKINKIAIIGNSGLLKWSFRILHPLSPLVINRFTHGELEKAQAWLAIT